MKKIIPERSRKFPRKGDQFIMQVVLCAGYGTEELQQLNRV
jgi:hypothetical protein